MIISGFKRNQNKFPIKYEFRISFTDELISMTMKYCSVKRSQSKFLFNIQYSLLSKKRPK